MNRHRRVPSRQKCQDSVGEYDRTTMSELPHLPDTFFADSAIVLTGSEINALIDAILIHDLMVDGCIAEAASLTTGDDGGYNRMVAETLRDVRAKLDKAKAPTERVFKDWTAAVDRWKAENPEEAQRLLEDYDDD